ncbi:unnamed protein product [Calicophoron daubneyi]|uniref:AN1-type zinc finger protein 4 n=1 Tax=Calicophoron daubneyi TaxID=300641 RepID=A0AAV2T4H4_CALDB
MLLFIRALSGVVTPLTVNPCETVLFVKTRLLQLKGIPIAQQHLIYDGVELSDSTALAAANIGHGALLRLVLALHSGPLSRDTPTPVSPSQSVRTQSTGLCSLPLPITHLSPCRGSAVVFPFVCAAAALQDQQRRQRVQSVTAGYFDESKADGEFEEQATEDEVSEIAEFLGYAIDENESQLGLRTDSMLGSAPDDCSKYFPAPSFDLPQMNPIDAIPVFFSQLPYPLPFGQYLPVVSQSDWFVQHPTLLANIEPASANSEISQNKLSGPRSSDDVYKGSSNSAPSSSSSFISSLPSMHPVGTIDLQNSVFPSFLPNVPSQQDESGETNSNPATMVEKDDTEQSAKPPSGSVLEVRRAWTGAPSFLYPTLTPVIPLAGILPWINDSRIIHHPTTSHLMPQSGLLQADPGLKLSTKSSQNPLHSSPQLFSSATVRPTEEVQINETITRCSDRSSSDTTREHLNQPTLPSKPIDRCFLCHRRTGLAQGFSCRCERWFCTKHHHPEDHGCAFDFKSIRTSSSLVSEIKNQWNYY